LTFLSTSTTPASAASTPERLNSFAVVNDDASLTVRGKRVQLHGLYVPRTDESCIDSVAADCRTRASAALRGKLRGFVDCRIRYARSRDELIGQCFMGKSTFDEGIDLGAWLIGEGWALASQDAPFEYQALERLASHQGKGIWGHSVVWTPWGYR
jgi:endonuclease YncB( thermonuclease family)